MSIKKELNDRRAAIKEVITAISNLEHIDIIDRIAKERLKGRGFAYRSALMDIREKLYSRAVSESRCESTMETYKEIRECVLSGESTLLDLAFFKGQAEGFADVHVLLEAEESNR